jgi:hypothetical protein
MSKLKWISLLSALIISTAVNAETASITAEKNLVDSANKLFSLNSATLSTYEAAKKREQALLGPTIVAMGDHITFYYHNKTQQFKIVPIEYTQLKTFSQLALGIFSFDMLASDSNWLSELKDYRAKMLIASQAINELTTLTDAQRNRQKQLVEKSQSFIDKTLQSKKIVDADLRQYFQEVGPLVWQNVNDASIAQINTLHKIMLSLRQEMPVADWEKLKVIVIGLHMPREKNLLTLYFSKLLKTEVDTSRLVYGEGLKSEKEGLDLLARMNLDTTLGAVVFNDPKRMRRDLLSDSAQKYLETLFSST